LSEHGPQDGAKHLSCGVGSTFFHGSVPFFRQFLSCNLFAFCGKTSIIEQYIISRKGAKPAKENKDKFFNNLGVFAPLRENLIWFRLVRVRFYVA